MAMSSCELACLLSVVAKSIDIIMSVSVLAAKSDNIAELHGCWLAGW